MLRRHQDMQPRTTPQRLSAIFGKEEEHSYLLVLFLIKGVNCRGKRPRKILSNNPVSALSLKSFLIIAHSPAWLLLPSSSLAKKGRAQGVYQINGGHDRRLNRVVGRALSRPKKAVRGNPSHPAPPALLSMC